MELDGLGKDEVVVYADEVDIHLNPKIGPCWMPKGSQFEVETPGKNQKRYVVGGLNKKTGKVIWIVTEKKNSAAFIAWLKHLRNRYRRYRRIHVVCDNYIIHKSKITCKAMDELMNDVDAFLKTASPYPGSRPSLAKAA